MSAQRNRDNLARAHAAESRASARYRAFALKADLEGRSQVARLFRAVADAKAVHSRRFLLLMRGKVAGTEENLQSALEEERSMGEKQYPGMVQDAKGEVKAVRKAFTQSMKTDTEYAGLYEEALINMIADKDKVYYVCQICGHIHEGSVPENCPVCKAVPGRFRRVL
jgi:rubrerythrin